MNILIKKDRSADQKYNKLNYVLDEEWLKLIAHDMRSALVDDKLDKQSPNTTPTSTPLMRHSNCHSAPLRSPMNLELPLSRKASKGKLQHSLSSR